jgi:microcystin-dependent protein
MSSPFVAEIRMFGFNFAPTGWAQCNGQLLPISQNTALFSLLGTFYGGDGKSTFALPNLQGSVGVNQGQGKGLQEWFLGQEQGSETETLLITEIPLHNHNIAASSANATVADPTGAVLGRGNFSFQGNNGAVQMYSDSAPNTTMNQLAVGVGGGGLPHNNLMPYLTVNFCIAMQGVFPPRQ